MYPTTLPTLRPPKTVATALERSLTGIALHPPTPEFISPYTFFDKTMFYIYMGCCDFCNLESGATEYILWLHTQWCSTSNFYNQSLKLHKMNCLPNFKNFVQAVVNDITNKASWVPKIQVHQRKQQRFLTCQDNLEAALHKWTLITTNTITILFMCIL